MTLGHISNHFERSQSFIFLGKYPVGSQYTSSYDTVAHKFDIISPTPCLSFDESKMFRQGYNQVIHLIRDTVWKSDKTQGLIIHKRVNMSAFSQQVIKRLQGTGKTV